MVKCLHGAYHQKQIWIILGPKAYTILEAFFKKENTQV